MCIMFSKRNLERENNRKKNSQIYIATKTRYVHSKTDIVIIIITYNLPFSFPYLSIHLPIE